MSEKLLDGGERPFRKKRETNEDTISSKTVKPLTDHKLIGNIAETFSNISRQTSNQINDYENLIKLLPYINLAKEIMVSSILSPKDMINTEINYTISTDNIKSSLVGSSIDLIRNYFEKEYQIKDKLKTILDNTLFKKGAHITLVIPENVVDHFINSQLVSTESYSKIKSYFNDKININGTLNSIGVLGSNKKAGNKKLSIESIKYANISIEEQKVSHQDKNEKITIDNLLVTDNIDVLRLPQIIYNNDKKNLFNIYNKKILNNKKSSNENFKEDIDKFYKKRKNNSSLTMTGLPNFLDIEKQSVGKPLILEVPIESVLPVYRSGNVEDHIGYFLLLDSNGRPIDAKMQPINYENMNGNSIGSYLTKRASTILNNTRFDINNNSHKEQINKIYASIVEEDLINRLKNSIFSDELSIANNNEVYNLMLSRTLANKNTQILFVPKMFLSYIAYQYNTFGIGKSLLEDVLVLCQFSIVARLADIIAGIKNSTGTTKIKVKLEESDTDPKKTIEELKHLYNSSGKVNIFPSISNLADIVDQLNNAGILWEYTGNSKLPDIEITKEQIQNNYVKIDPELINSLKKDILAGFGVNPEIIDNGFNSEFATTAAANNILFTKTILAISNKLLPLINYLYKLILSYDFSLRDKLYELIDNNYKNDKECINDKELKSKNTDIIEAAIDEIINHFNIILPKPASVTLKRQAEDLNDYIDLVDKSLDFYISDKMYTSNLLGDELAGKVVEWRELIKSHLVRDFMNEKGIMSELTQLVTLNEHGDINSKFKTTTEEAIKTIIGTSVVLDQKLLEVIKQIQDKNNETNEKKDNLGISTDMSDTDNNIDESSNLNDEEPTSEEQLSEDNVPAMDDSLEDNII